LFFYNYISCYIDTIGGKDKQKNTIQRHKGLFFTSLTQFINFFLVLEGNLLVLLRRTIDSFSYSRTAFVTCKLINKIHNEVCKYFL